MSAGQLLVLLMNGERVSVCDKKKIVNECPTDEPIVAFIVVQILVCFVVSIFFSFVFISFRIAQPTLHSWRRHESYESYESLYIYLYFILNDFFITNTRRISSFWTKKKWKRENEHLQQWNVHLASVSKRFSACYM